ncbi:SAM-dependent DNA methyltransferase, partial [Thermodesulfobacteriota bacterium]
LVTQRAVGQDTNEIREKAPLTWQYLEKHGALLDRRASSIYRDRPRFSVFGVGEYSFSPWKVAISGFYKKLEFKVIGPFQGRPVVLDDTCYFVACASKEEAELVSRLLTSDIAKQFFSARVFWDAKRPITVALLRRLDLLSLAKELGLEDELKEHLNRSAPTTSNPDQPPVNLGL